MTSPSVDLDGIMPWGVNVSADKLTTYPTPDGDSSRFDGSFILLPTGPCQIQFSWPGKQDAYVRWVDSANNEKGIPIEISGGGVFPKDRYHRRSPRRQTTGAHPLQRQSRYDRNRHNLSNTTLTKAVVKHDHTAGESGQHFAVCDSLQDRHRRVHGDRIWAARRRGVLHASRRCVPGAAGVYRAGGRRGVVDPCRAENHSYQDVPNPRRCLRHATQCSTTDHTSERGRPALHHDYPAPQRGSETQFHRVTTPLPTSQLTTAGVVA